MTFVRMIISAACAMIFCTIALCQTPDFNARSLAGKYVRVAAVPKYTAIRSGDSVVIAVDIRIADGWVYYSPEPGASAEYSPLPAGMNVFVDSVPAKDFRITWPKADPHETDLGDTKVTNFVYMNRAVVYISLKLPADAGKKVKITVEPTGQICKDSCIDIRSLSAETSVELLPVGATTGAIENPQWRDDPTISSWDGKLQDVSPPKASITTSPVVAQTAAPATGSSTIEFGFWYAMAMAILAGLAMNIMPCVLPIIPLRIYSIVQLAGQSRRRYVTMGLAFAGGILLFFVAIAVANAALQLVWQRTFQWAEHFQLVGVRVAMILLLLAVAANMFGAFNILIPASLAKLEENSAPRSGHLSALGMGLMMAIFSTPCGFGILGAVLAWAQFQPLWSGTLAFVMLGVGMAVPHAILAAFPSLIKSLPRPGRWMELFKQSMGFAMLLPAAWLVGTFDSSGYAGWVVGYCVVFAFSLWMWGSWVTSQASAGRKFAIRFIAAALAIGAGIFMLKPADADRTALTMTPFDQAAIVELNNAGKTVIVKFTASWCAECKVIDARIYKDASIADELGRRNVSVMVGDATNRDSVASQWLQRNGKSVPLTAVFRPGQPPPKMLVGMFTKQELLDAIDRR